jgi:hypothetical protein
MIRVRTAPDGCRATRGDAAGLAIYEPEPETARHRYEGTVAPSGKQDAAPRRFNP